jgi:hypothetical protein
MTEWNLIKFDIISDNKNKLRVSFLKTTHMKMEMETVPDFSFSSVALPAHSGPRPPLQLHNRSLQMVGFFGRVISSSQGLYLNTE